MTTDDRNLRPRALALYTPPFRYEQGYIWDANGEMFADDHADAVIRPRGWGRVSHLAEPEKAQAAVGHLIAEALTFSWRLFQQSQQAADAPPFEDPEPVI